MNTYDSEAVNHQLQSQALDFSRIEVLVRQAPLAIIISLSVSGLITPILWSELPHSFLSSWLTILFLIAICRFFLFQHIKNELSGSPLDYTSAQLKFYEQLCAVGAFCSGLTFGALGFLFSPELSLPIQFIISFMMAGITACAITINISSSINYYAFIIPALLPMSYGLYQSDMQFAAVFILIYLVLMLLLIKRVSHIFVHSLSLKAHNLDLVSNLTEQNSELRDLLTKLHNSEQLSSGAFNKAGVTMMLIDKNLQIFKVNHEACMLLSYSEQQLTSLGILDLSHPDERPHSEQLFADLLAGKRPQYQSRKRYLREDGIDIWVQEIISSVIDEEGLFEYGIIHAQDVTQEFRLTKKLSYQANHDVLTGLLNRYAFETTMQRLFLRQENDDRQEHNQHVFCYIDLDQFNVVNDTFGHSVGDDLLRELAKILKRNIAKSHTLARIGGDEFALLIPDSSLERARSQLEKLLAAIRLFSFSYEQQTLNPTASIGLVTFDLTSSMTEVLKQADSACYAAKAAGRDRLHIYHQDDAYLSQRTGEMTWVSKIQKALTEKKFILYSQQIMPIGRDSELAHYELLIRMRADDGSIIPPGLFLPAAEHYNLASAIDLWVVEHVLDTLAKARDNGKDISGVYGVNLSGQSLGDKRFYEDIISRIKHIRLIESNAVICFEITETAAISNMSAALYFINELRSIGCQFALDDFGSGLSSYAYLQQMPVDFLKIDGMFVKDCLADPVKFEMIKSINNVGHVMGLKTIAEFVENDEIFNKLGEIDIDYAQGYWNGPPKAWLIKNKTD